MMKSSELGSTPTWDDNWTLLRKLWPEWNPTEEQIREVWFQAYDKKHGLRGENRVNQDALREAILGHARSKRWKEPVFIDIADAYRHERGRHISEIERARSSSSIEDEKAGIEDEAERLRDQIARWPTERMMRARELVQEKIPTFAGKSTDPDTWSRTYMGFLSAADQELNEGK